MNATSHDLASRYLHAETVGSGVGRCQRAVLHHRPCPRRRSEVHRDGDALVAGERGDPLAMGEVELDAADGVEALQVLRSQPIDLVVSDVNMPRLDGFGLTAEMRRDQKLRLIPVVLVTSLDEREHRERGVEVGADAYIAKADFDQNLLLIGCLLGRGFTGDIRFHTCHKIFHLFS